MTDWFQFLRDLILRYIGLHLMDNFSFEDSSVLFTNIWPPGGFLFVLYLFAFITNGTNLYQVIHNWLNLFYHWIDFFSPSGMRNMFAYFGCCILRMVLTANKFMYSKPLSIEKLLFAYRTFYFFGFISDIFWKLNFYALSPMCNVFDKARKTRASFGVSTSLFIHVKKNVSKCTHFTETHRKKTNFNISTCHFCFIQTIIYYLRRNQPCFRLPKFYRCSIYIITYAKFSNMPVQNLFNFSQRTSMYFSKVYDTNA